MNLFLKIYEKYSKDYIKVEAYKKIIGIYEKKGRIINLTKT